VRTSSSSSLTCGPKQPGLESSQLHCLWCPSTDGLSTSTIQDNQPAKAGNRHWVGQTIVLCLRFVYTISALYKSLCMYVYPCAIFGPPGSCHDSYKLLLAYLSWNKPNIAENWFSMPITECGVVILITEIYKATFYWSLRFEWHSRNRYSMQHVTDVKVFMFTAASTEYQESSSTSNVISQTSSPSSTVRSTTPGQSDSHQDVSGIIHISLLNMASGINIYSVFWISEIIILDIQNKVYHQLYSGYPE